MSVVALRIAVGLEGLSRIVSNMARCTNERSVFTSARSSGCLSSQLKRLSSVRTNAVADVCAPARRKKAISFRMISSGRWSESSFLSNSVRMSFGSSTVSSVAAAAISCWRRLIDGARNCTLNSLLAPSTSLVTSFGSRVVCARVAPSMNFIMKP